MLEYLVPSKVRRRLLLLLWGENARGSVAQLAEQADVAFAGAHAELKAMQRAQLVRSEYDGRREVFEANLQHPESAALRALVAASAAGPRAPREKDDEAVRSRLVSLGAPLRGVAPLAVPTAERMSALVNGVALARLDPTVARCLPLCFWRLRDDLDIKQLASLVNRPEDKHALGFFLELTATLGGDRRLAGLAENLRDARMTALRGFFQVGSSRDGLVRDFQLATKWGYEMNMDLDSFQTLFEKFVSRG
jgi:hypothetical protein